MCKPSFDGAKRLLTICFVALLASQVAYADNSAQDWIRQGEKLRDAGALTAAQSLFEQALSSADTHSQIHIAALAASGYNQLLLNNLTQAEQKLQEAYDRSKGYAYLHVLSAEYLGSLYLSQGLDYKADAIFKTAYLEAKQNHFAELAASISLLSLIADDKVNPQQLVRDIFALPVSNAKARLQLQIAEYMLNFDVGNIPPEEKSAWIASIYQAITSAQQFAIDNQQTRSQAEAGSLLARLYLQQGRSSEALTLTEQAIVLANSLEAKELLVKLFKLRGDSYKQQHNFAAALQAYQEAAERLNLIKPDLPINLPDGRSTVEVLIDPIYRSYADILLRFSASSQALPNDDSRIKVISAMEAIKKSDLESFFLSRCSLDLADKSDWVHHAIPGAAIFYPIVFDDRVELLLKKDSGIFRRTVYVSSQALNQQVKKLVLALKSGKNYKSSAQKLFEWLYAPVSADLNNLQTLVFVPDRSLRGMPLSALFDGKHFVVEKQAVVTLPGLELKNLFRSKTNQYLKQTLIAGISKPDGPSLDSLPPTIAQNLSPEDQPASTNRQIQRGKLVDALSLPAVEKEVNEISHLRESDALLNKNFTADLFKDNLESGDYSTVHIASHGYFGNNVKDSFVMAYDRNLSLQDFQASLENDNLKQNPIDLLALSACETAQGNDRLLLGFSGLAVKSNALSAVGSLWSINDAAALQFMKNFYSNLNQSMSKAKAIQQAQVAMIKSKDYQHPYYWSPFVLIGNWQ